MQTLVIGAVEDRISVYEKNVINALYLSTGSMSIQPGVVCSGRADIDQAPPHRPCRLRAHAGRSESDRPVPKAVEARAGRWAVQRSCTSYRSAIAARENSRPFSLLGSGLMQSAPKLATRQEK